MRGSFPGSNDCVCHAEGPCSRARSQWTGGHGWRPGDPPGGVAGLCIRGAEARVGAMVMGQEKRGRALELSTSRTKRPAGSQGKAQALGSGVRGQLWGKTRSSALHHPRGQWDTTFQGLGERFGLKGHPPTEYSHPATSPGPTTDTAC